MEECVEKKVVEKKPCLCRFVLMEESEEVVCKVPASSEPTMNVNINGIVKNVLIDSGSVCNLIGRKISTN